MGRISYSSIETWWNCPYQYRLRYIDKLKTKPRLDPDNALFEGTSIHEAIENRSIEKGLNSYKSNYPIIDKEHEFEMYKLEKAMMKGIEQIPEGDYEYKLLTEDFVGYIDMLVHVGDNVYDLYDFKYTSNINGYKDSAQIHLYKYYYEHITGNKIRDIYYVFVPKCPVKYSDSPDARSKVDEFYNSNDVIIQKVDFDRQKVNYFFARKKLLEKATSFEKRFSWKCKWCDYKKYCDSNGKDKSELFEEVIEDKNAIGEVDLWN